MKAQSSLLTCACSLMVVTLASARPFVIEESATSTSPDPAKYPTSGCQVATNGDYALAFKAATDFDDYVAYQP